MRKSKTLFCIFTLLWLVSCTGEDSPFGLDSGAKITEERAFAAKPELEVETVSGNCIIKTGGTDSIHVLVEYAFDPPDAFEAIFREEANRLILEEKFHGSASGESRWTVTAPPATEVIFASVSGNIAVVDISGDLAVTTVSGSATAANIAGAISVSTVSGNINIEDADAGFQINTVSGNINLRNITCADEGSFNTVSGNIYIGLAATAAYDLALNTVSGNAVLDYNGHPVQGYFELTAGLNTGRIVSPFAFDLQETFMQSGQEYRRVSFTRGGSVPYISINTTSGRAELRE